MYWVDVVVRVYWVDVRVFDWFLGALQSCQGGLSLTTNSVQHPLG